jgi:hypothetical protein
MLFVGCLAESIGFRKGGRRSHPPENSLQPLRRAMRALLGSVLTYHSGVGRDI